MDLNASLRALSSFLPTRASDASYLDGFLDELLTASIASPKPDELSRAKEACKAWLTRYASRASEEQEIKAWEEEVVDTSTEAVQKFADTAAKVDAEGNAWEGKRRTVMARTNPRFVLRQWVLEELIAELTALGVGDTAGEEEYAEARRRLARVLDVSKVVSPRLERGDINRRGVAHGTSRHFATRSSWHVASLYFLLLSSRLCKVAAEPPARPARPARPGGVAGLLGR
jgi:hypothetical protein